MKEKISRYKNIARNTLRKYSSEWTKKGIKVSDLLSKAEENLSCGYELWGWHDWDRFALSVRKFNHLKGYDILQGIYNK